MRRKVCCSANIRFQKIFLPKLTGVAVTVLLAVAVAESAVTVRLAPAVAEVAVMAQVAPAAKKFFEAGLF